MTSIHQWFQARFIPREERPTSDAAGYFVVREFLMRAKIGERAGPENVMRELCGYPRCGRPAPRNLYLTAALKPRTEDADRQSEKGCWRENAGWNWCK